MSDLVDLLARADQLLSDHPPLSTPKLAFLRAQYDAGLAWVHYPPGYGGASGSIDDQAAVDDRLAAGGAPPNGRMTNAIGAGQCAATVLAFGSDAQKERYLPAVFTGEAPWCQLFSEPGAGSDLASLATRAVLDGDEWIVNGQKVWTSGADGACHALLLARTEPGVEKHAGITAFAVDMQAAGVEVRPLRQMNGGVDFNEVFLRDVRIPDAERLGDVGAGWKVSQHTLLQERYNMPRIPGRGDGPISLAVAAWRARADKESPAARSLRAQLMERWVEAEVLRLLQVRASEARAAGGGGAEGSLGKVAVSLVWQRIAHLLPALVGVGATLIDSYESGVEPTVGRRGPIDAGPFATQHLLLRSPSMSIAGGTDQIQRNIIGERVLGLPREPNPEKGLPWSKTLRS